MKELPDIVRQVVLDYFADKHNRPSKKKIAILLEYDSIDDNETWEHLRDLSHKYQLQLILGEAWREVPLDLQHIAQILLQREQRDTILEWIEASEVLYIPNGSYAMLAKLALTIDDDLAPWIAIQTQLRGRSILMLNDGLLPSGKLSLSAPPKLLDKIKSYQRQLMDEGIYFSNRQLVVNWLENHLSKSKKRKVILARHIEESVQNGVYEWKLSKDEILTPLARDRARELGLQIHKVHDQETKEGRS